MYYSAIIPKEYGTYAGSHRSVLALESWTTGEGGRVVGFRARVLGGLGFRGLRLLGLGFAVS